MENSDSQDQPSPEPDSKTDDALDRWRRFAGGPANGFFTRLLDMFSKPAGLVILTFVLTTVIGTFANNLWQAAESERTSDQANVDKRDREIQDAMNGIKKTLMERAAASDQLIVALELKEDSKTIDDLWSAYQRAYHDENVAYLSSQLRLEGLTDLLPAGASGAVFTTTFWNYLDLVIQPRFNDLHVCIVALKGAYALPGSTTATLTSDFLKCSYATTPDDLVRINSKMAYWDQFAGTGKAVTLWSRFKTCLEVYSFQLDWNLMGQRQLSEEASREREDSDWLAHPVRAIERWSSPDQASNWQNSFLCQMRQRLEDDCGVYPMKEHERSTFEEIPDRKTCGVTPAK